MKKYIYCIILITYACTTSEITQESYTFQEICQTLKEEHKNVIKDIQTSRQYILAGRSTESINKDPFSKFFATMDDYQYYQIPVYRFDLNKFYTNPSEENIPNGIILTNIIKLIAEKDGKIDFSIIAKKDETTQTWYDACVTHNYSKTINWLRDSLFQANTKEYKIFTVLGKECVTYEKNGKPLYFRITGEPFTPAKFCEFLVNEYNFLQETLKK